VLLSYCLSSPHPHCQVNKPAHCFTSKMKASCLVLGSFLASSRAGAMLTSACVCGCLGCFFAMAPSSRGHDASARVSLPWLLYRVGMMHVRVCVGAMLASAVCRCFVACMGVSYRCERARRRHGCFVAWARRTRACVAALAALSRGHEASAEEPQIGELKWYSGDPDTQGAYSFLHDEASAREPSQRSCF